MGMDDDVVVIPLSQLLNDYAEEEAAIDWAHEIALGMLLHLTGHTSERTAMKINREEFSKLFPANGGTVRGRLTDPGSFEEFALWVEPDRPRGN